MTIVFPRFFSEWLIPEKQKIEILYDGDCPFCSRYVAWLRLKQHLDVVLTDARAESALKTRSTAQRINLDKGMVVSYGGNLYVGPEAMTLLTLLSSRSGLFNKFMAVLFSNMQRSKIFYPVLAFLRGIVLKMLLRRKINNIK